MDIIQRSQSSTLHTTFLFQNYVFQYQGSVQGLQFNVGIFFKKNINEAIDNEAKKLRKIIDQASI